MHAATIHEFLAIVRAAHTLARAEFAADNLMNEERGSDGPCHGSRVRISSYDQHHFEATDLAEATAASIFGKVSAISAPASTMTRFSSVNALPSIMISARTS